MALSLSVAITGASGLIGTALQNKLKLDGHTPIPVTRKAGGEGIHWDPATGEIDAASFEGVDAVIHLAGESVGAGRWSDAQKARIMDSRVNGTTLLSTTLANLNKTPSVLLSSSAMGFYGSRGDEVLTEESDRGPGFLADVCVAWEDCTKPAEDAGIRVAHMRTGLVLTERGGAMGKMVPLYKLGLGGRMGSGKQWWSWISIDDEIGAMSWMLTNPVSGPVNLTAPNPVTNAEFNKTMGKVLKRPTFMTVPSFGPKLLMGSEMAEGLLFGSSKVLPKVLEDSGYTFVHSHLEPALRDIFGKEEERAA